MLGLIDVSWPGVVLLLGIVGLSLATVCFAIYVVSRPIVVNPTVPPTREPWPGEKDTEVIPPK